MREYVTRAIVLEKEPLRDADARYIFFTEKFGKVVGKATSSRKITSKLAGHLEPGSIAQVRFIDRNHGSGTQIADALKESAATAPIGDLSILQTMLIEGETDLALWEELTAAAFSWNSILRLLGWDPHDAVCETCGRKATAFYVPRQSFFCAQCSSKLARDKLSLVTYDGV